MTKEFSVYFEGEMSINANDRTEAMGQCYEYLKEVVPSIQFDITGIQED
jgi:hypothetical protein